MTTAKHEVVDFWFEFASTYSYLSVMRINDEAAKRGVTVRWRPFLLGPIFAQHGWDTSPFVVYPAKGQNMWRDIERRAAKYGFPVTRPPEAIMGQFPRHSVLAARACLVGLGEGWGKEFAKRVYHAEFVDHADISDVEVLRPLIAKAGGDPAAAFSAAQSQENKDRLRSNVEQAMALGIYGAPSFVVGDELFWGDDRLEDALDWAVGI